MKDDSKYFDELIDSQLSSVELEKQLVIDFADKSQIVISLLPEDYTCP